MKRCFLLVAILLIPLALAWQVRSSLAGTTALLDGPTIYIPLVSSSYTAQPIIVDHRHTDISQIPDYWLGEAKKFVVHYAHTSHGSQVLSGLEWLETRNAKYNVDILVGGPAEVPDDATALRIYDGNNYPDNYIEPQEYWEAADGIDHTRAVADTGWFDFSLWTWCGQLSGYSDEQVQQYLDVMTQFEADYPAMRFILYTGHTDGQGTGETLWHNNDLIRQYTLDNNMVLFDFADIEAYDPAGNFYPNATDSCTWCSAWCNAHKNNFECQNLPTDCAHTNGLLCTLKGQAFWWLMARLAGWDGVVMK